MFTKTSPLSQFYVLGHYTIIFMLILFLFGLLNKMNVCMKTKKIRYVLKEAVKEIKLMFKTRIAIKENKVPRFSNDILMAVQLCKIVCI